MPVPDSPRTSRAVPQLALRRARWGASTAFLLTGFVFATWAARIPALKAGLGLSDAQLAIALVGLNAGAVAGLQLGSVVVTRRGSRRALLVALPVFAGTLVAIAFAPSLAGLSLTVAASAGANSVVDVAINDQGVGVQHRYGRSLLTGMHAMHSLGGVLGGAVAAFAAHVGLGVVAHFSVVAAVVAAVALVSNRALLAPDELHGSAQKDRSVPLTSGWTGRLLVLGAVAFMFTLAEGSALDWSAVLLADHRGASPALAATGLAVFQAAVTVGRLVATRSSTGSDRSASSRPAPCWPARASPAACSSAAPPPRSWASPCSDWGSPPCCRSASARRAPCVGSRCQWPLPASPPSATSARSPGRP